MTFSGSKHNLDLVRLHPPRQRPRAVYCPVIIHTVPPSQGKTVADIVLLSSILPFLVRTVAVIVRLSSILPTLVRIVAVIVLGRGYRMNDNRTISSLWPGRVVCGDL